MTAEPVDDLEDLLQSVNAWLDALVERAESELYAAGIDPQRLGELLYRERDLHRRWKREIAHRLRRAVPAHKPFGVTLTRESSIQ